MQHVMNDLQGVSLIFEFYIITCPRDGIAGPLVAPES